MPSLRQRLRAVMLNLLLLLTSAAVMALLSEGAVRWLDLFAAARDASRIGQGQAWSDDGGTDTAPGAMGEPDDHGDGTSADSSADGGADDNATLDGAKPPKGKRRPKRDLPPRSERANLHPFLGWSIKPGDREPDGRLRRFPSNAFGLRSQVNDYRELSDDAFVLGIFGGSVAQGVCLHGQEAIIEQLETLRPELAGRVVVATFSAGGYKQPQQLFLFAEALLLGVPFDAVVSLDGFNEVALGDESALRGFHPIFPHRQFWEAAVDLGTGRLSDEQIELSAEVLRSRRRADELRQGLATSWKGHSELLRATYGVILQRLDTRAVSAEKTLRELPQEPADDPLVNLSAPCLGQHHGCLPLIVELWQRASLAMDALAHQQGIPYIHALQPSQYLEGSKPLAKGELERAYDPKAPWSRSAVAGYPLLRVGGEALRQQGVDFLDLTQIFHDNENDLYRDPCCHVNITGSRILGAAIGTAVARALSDAEVRSRPQAVVP